MATVSAGISTAVRNRNAKISMRLRRGRPLVSSLAKAMRDPTRDFRIGGIGAAAGTQHGAPRVTSFDLDQGNPRSLEGTGRLVFKLFEKPSHFSEIAILLTLAANSIPAFGPRSAMTTPFSFPS